MDSFGLASTLKAREVRLNTGPEWAFLFPSTEEVLGPLED